MSSTVLFVDDEINVIKSLKRGLADEDCRCLYALSAFEALEILEKEEIAVVVTDMKMPGMDGLTFLKKVKERYPLIVKIVLTGYIQLQQMLTMANQVDVFKFITKPWKLEDEFKPIIRQALEYYNMQIENAGFKKDFESTRQLGAGIFRILNSSLIDQNKNVKDNADLSYKVELIKRLYLGYLDTLPTFRENFDSKKLVEEIERCLSNMKRVTTIKVNSYPSYWMCFGNYRLLFFIISNLLIEIINLNKSKIEIRLDIKVEETIGSTTMFILNTEIQSKKNCDSDISSNLQLISIILCELCKILNGNLVIQTQENNTLLKLSLHIAPV